MIVRSAGAIVVRYLRKWMVLLLLILLSFQRNSLAPQARLQTRSIDNSLPGSMVPKPAPAKRRLIGYGAPAAVSKDIKSSRPSRPSRPEHTACLPILPS